MSARNVAIITKKQESRGRISINLFSMHNKRDQNLEASSWNLEFTKKKKISKLFYINIARIVRGSGRYDKR